MRTIIKCVKQPTLVLLLLAIVLSAMQCFAQEPPKPITIGKYNQLPIKQQIDTSYYYVNFYCTFPNLYPGKKIPNSYTSLIKSMISSFPSLLKNPSLTKKEQCKIYGMMGVIHWTTSFYNIDTAMYYLNKGLNKSLEDTSLWKFSSYFLTLRGIAYEMNLDSFAKAADIGKKVLDIASAHKDTNYIAISYLLTGYAYYNSRDSLLPVEDYYFKAAALFKNKNHEFYNTSIIDAVQFLISMYQEYGSVTSLEKAKRLHKELTAYNYQHQYKTINFDYYTSLAYFSLFAKDTTGFLHYADSARAMVTGVGGYGDWQQTTHFLLYAYFLSKDYQKFITTLHSNYILSRKSLFPEKKLELLNMASIAFAAMKQYDSAYFYKKQYSEFQDSVTLTKNALAINTLYKKYNVSQKQHEIDKLETQKKQNEIIALIIGLILVSGIFIIYTRMRIKAKKMQQQIAQLDTATEYHIYELEEKEKSVKAEERKRLGMELHDGLSGTLAAIKHKTELITPDKPAEQLKEELTEITQLLNEAYSMARNKSHDLYKASEVQEDFSFSERVKLILKNTLPANIQHKEITIDDISLTQIPVKVKIELLQIIKESVTNILKHAKANSISLLLYSETDEVLLTILDDGKGFDTSSPSFKRGVGLNSIYQRVQDIHGKLNIVSAVGKGTELQIALPLPDNQII